MLPLTESARGWIGMAVLLGATVGSVLSGTPAAVAGLNAVTLLVTILYAPLGAVAWFAVLPFTFHWPAEAGQYVAFRQSLVALLGCTLIVVARRSRSEPPDDGLPRLHRSGSAFLLTFCFSIAISALVTRVPAEMHIGLISILGVLMCLATGWSIRAHPAGFRVISTAIALVAVLAVGIALAEYGGGQARLRVGDNVRKVATPVGLAVTILLCGFLSRGDSADIPLRGKRGLQLLLTLVLVAALAVTMSRGTALAVAAAVGAFVATRLALGERSDLSLSVGKLVGAFTVTAGAGFYLWEQLARSPFGLRFVGRWMEFLAEPGEAIRIRIWRSALGEMSTWEWLIGAGPGSFRRLALEGGLDYYAHSVFVDVLVTNGIVGLLILCGFLVWIALRLWSSGSSLGMALLAYTVISFATFGAAAQSFFWASTGLAYGLAWRGRDLLREEPHL